MLCPYLLEICQALSEAIMKRKDKVKDELPEEFDSLEEAGEFWDTHDITDYAEHMEDVEVETEFKMRHFEIEIEEDVLKLLVECAQKEGISLKKLVAKTLKRAVKDSVKEAA